ncbi:hypothetical protein RFI_28956 [Reticulomyxa filosa]|uniref:Ankyrin repeat protein n=1 Tax=Reticulomyxa filosa TaxID=46433 RepID=X6M4A0_RETFI|nr:hypothetical protein RFI_28956 [Reticulomyxa filosa]|eukprot:ETO08431.1 hypothetical protein RFI_28956 [Reticulomyxa filosa]
MNDSVQYAWQNMYRIGTVFHAILKSNMQFFKSLTATTTMTTTTTTTTLAQDQDKDKDKDKDALPLEQWKDIAGHNLLHVACAYNNAEFIKEYVHLFDPNQPDPNGWSPMRIACDVSFCLFTHTHTHIHIYICIYIAYNILHLVFFFEKKKKKKKRTRRSFARTLAMQ